MMKRTIAVVIMIFMVAVTSGHTEPEQDINAIVDKIQDKYEKINEFQAEFEQEAEVAALDTTEKASGKVWFKKPGKMRWDYRKPYEDQIVSDGENIWYYNSQEQQVMKSSLEHLNSETSSTTLISGLGQLEKLFDAEFANDKNINTSDENYLISLSPKENLGSDEPYDKIIISVDRKDSMVKEIYLFDPFGNKTKITLSGFKINKGISDSLFDYSPPKGAELVDTTASGKNP